VANTSSSVVGRSRKSGRAEESQIAGLGLYRTALGRCCHVFADFATAAVCHHVELRFSAFKFLEHFKNNVPGLENYLPKIPTPDLLNAITAKSCNALGCYEKLEWLGDGVLKLVQTDSLVNSTNLGSWIRSLPGGYLNSARSYMGSNKYLTNACQTLKLDTFIHKEPKTKQRSHF
jgi:hypothetical protein